MSLMPAAASPCFMVIAPARLGLKSARHRALHGKGVRCHADMTYGRHPQRPPLKSHVLTCTHASRSISKDMVPFDIPVTFTITPHDPSNDKVGFLRYAQRMNGLTEAEYHTILTGIIHGQTRILAGEGSA